MEERRQLLRESLGNVQCQPVVADESEGERGWQWTGYVVVCRYHNQAQMGGYASLNPVEA